MAAPAALPPFERVIELHGPALLAFCRAQAGAARAEDCFQETMLAALRCYRSVREEGAIRSWLFAIAARKAVDLHRVEAKAQPLAELEPLDPGYEPLHRDEALWARVNGLPSKQRQAVTLRFAGELSHQEIASAMKTTEAAARRNLFEGLKRLRREVTP